MHTIGSDFLLLHRAAVLASVDIVSRVRPADLSAPTPCAGWTLADLLAHMTAQHRGFAAAARGFGDDPEAWRSDAIGHSIATDPAGTYAAAATDVLEAFAADGVADRQFALPDFGPGVHVDGTMAMGFHFVDYVVHGWDVAATLGLPYRLGDDVIAAALPVALAVPDGDFRTAPGAPFARAVDSERDDDFAHLLRHLGRRPDWRAAE